MKLLLDECVPGRLKYDFPGHDVLTVAEIGLNGLSNVALLRAAAAHQFEGVLTVDRKMSSQQNISQHGLALIVLSARPCRYPQLRALVPRVISTLNNITPGETVLIE